MITVKPIQQKEEQQRLCAVCGIPYRCEALAYRGDHDDVFAGMCQFKIDAQGGHIYQLASPPGEIDEDTLFIICRTAMNFIDLCGIRMAFFEGEGISQALLYRIGFTLDSNRRYSIDLSGFFTNPCQNAAH